MNNYENSNKQKGFELNIIGYLLELSKKIWLIAIIAVVFGLLGGVAGKVTSQDVYKSEVAFIVNTLAEAQRLQRRLILPILLNIFFQDVFLRKRCVKNVRVTFRTE